MPPCRGTALRALSIRFNAYNPLAGGLLTGRYESFDSLDAATPDTRFGGAGSYGKAYGKMYQVGPRSLLGAASRWLFSAADCGQTHMSLCTHGVPKAHPA